MLVCLTAPLGYYAFLRILSYDIRQSYLLAIVALLAAAIDLIIAHLAWIRLVRVARLVLVIVVVIIFPLAAWPKVIRRQTTVDLVTQRLQEAASPNDLIVVDPWFVGVSFHWYYHGPTRWLTVPVISDHRIHRWDLVKTKMMAFGPLNDLENAVSATLESGNRVWLVGGALLLRENEAPLQLSPAPDPKFGWKNDIYEKAWSEELGGFIQQHALRTDVILPPGRAVNKVENVSLWVAEGWKG